MPILVPRRVSSPLTREQKEAVCPLADVKAHARIKTDTENDFIRRLIRTSYDYLFGPDGYIGGFCLLEEEWECLIPLHHRWPLELPLRPLAGTTVSTVSYSVDGLEPYIDLDAGLWSIRETQTFPKLGRTGKWGWPMTTAPGQSGTLFRVRFRAGLIAVDRPQDTPETIVQAMMMLVAYWIRNREAVGQASDQVKFGLNHLLSPYRVLKDHD